MIARLGYFLRETAINIRRNVTLTVAAVLTVGAQALGEGLGAAGSAAVTAATTAAAVKPIILLGLGKCECSKNNCLHLQCLRLWPLCATKDASFPLCGFCNVI